MTLPLYGLAFAALCCMLLWLVSLRIRDASIIDIFWGPGIAGVVDIAAVMDKASGPRASVALFLVNIWAVRLAAHIWARRKGEDPRYAAMRQHYGRRWWWQSLFQVFLLQAILIWFIPIPLVAAVVSSRAALGPLDYIGIILAALGLLFEAIADFQLAAFRTDPANKGRVLDRGLWAWSRHPNYFGDALMWWGFFVLGYAASHAWWIAASPAVMTFLLLQVSGVTSMEQTIARRRPAYGDYQQRVSAFFPRRPGR